MLNNYLLAIERILLTLWAGSLWAAGFLVALDVAAGIEMRRHELEPIGVAKDR